jgi:hypothetical protein
MGFDSLFWAIGVATVIAFVCGLLWAAVDWLYYGGRWCIQQWLANRRQRIIAEAEEVWRYRLASDANWFSEDPATTNAIMGLAKGKHVTDVRQQWRKDRAAQDLHRGA